MNFQLPEGEAVEDEELQELFEGLETIPGLIIADDVLVEDEGLAALFDELEDAPTFSPMASNLNIGRNRRELYPGEAALRSGQTLPQKNGCLLQPDATVLPDFLVSITLRTESHCFRQHGEMAQPSTRRRGTVAVLGRAPIVTV
jgi:hypothetical protein